MFKFICFFASTVLLFLASISSAQSPTTSTSLAQEYYERDAILHQKRWLEGSVSPQQMEANKAEMATLMQTLLVNGRNVLDARIGLAEIGSELSSIHNQEVFAGIKNVISEGALFVKYSDLSVCKISLTIIGTKDDYYKMRSYILCVDSQGKLTHRGQKAYNKNGTIDLE